MGPGGSFPATRTPVVEDTAPGSKQSPSLTPVLLSFLRAKEMVPCSLRELLGLCSATGFPLEIGLDPARQNSKLCPSGFPLKPTFFLCEMGVTNIVNDS